jgi:hypothetical protein
MFSSWLTRVFREKQSDLAQQSGQRMRLLTQHQRQQYGHQYLNWGWLKHIRNVSQNWRNRASRQNIGIDLALLTG